MNAAVCEILRHRPVERHGLGIPAVWCDCCGFDFPSSGAVPGVETLSPQGLGHPQSAGAPTRYPTEGARGQKPMGVPAAKRADALAGGSSASDPAASGRVIARATPGPAVPVTRHDAQVGARVRPASGGSQGSSSRPDAEAPAAGPSPR